MSQKLAYARQTLDRVERDWQTSQHVSSPVISLGIPDISLGIRAYGIHEIYGQMGHGGSLLFALYLGQLCHETQKNKNIFFISLNALSPGKLYIPACPLPVKEIRTNSLKESYWTFEECLGAGQASCVICDVPFLDLTQSRRLQLACEKGHSLGLTLCQDSRGQTQSSAAHTRWRISGKAGYWAVELFAGRGVRPGRWIMDYDATKVSLSLVPATGDRTRPASQYAG